MWFLVVLATLFSLIFTPDILAHSETVIVKITASGFEPQTITVDQNSTIIFVNKDQQGHWPASNIHPTHDIYPEFDPKKPIALGDSWLFKPKKIGEWKYHDHLFPHIRGKVTVISENGQEQTSSWQQQFSDFIGQIILKFKSIFSFKKNDAQKNWEVLKQKYIGQAGSAGDIHDQAHLAGSLLYKEKGLTGISICSPEFAFGCYHGFLDEAFKKDLSRLNDAYNACSKLGQGLSGPVASCLHGIGHGVASFHGSSDLKASLASCRKLSEGREYCFDGVFMEFVRSAPETFYKQDDPLYPCNELEKEFGPAYSFACGRNTPSLLMSRFNRGFSEVADICRKASSKPFKEACFDSLGFSLASSTDTDQIIRGCQSISIPEYILSCTKAAAGELVFQEVPDWQEKSQAVCQSLSWNQDECLDHVNRLIKEYSRIKKINFTPRSEGENPDSYIRSQMKICYDSNGADGCYKQVAQLLYDTFGLKDTLAFFKSNEDYPEVYARCHEVTHYLSRLEYERLGSIAGVYAQCDSTCHGGCYHGTLEAYLKAKNLKDDDLKKEFVKVCGIKEDHPSPLVFNECFHGLGHAAMFIKDMELKESLELCDTISSQEYKERCFTGVFMENSSSSTSFDHTSKYIKPDDPFYPCNALEEKYLTICWRYQSSYFAILTGNNWPEVSKLCLKIPQNYQSECFRTIGTNQVGYTQDPAIMKANCELVPAKDLQNVCVVGVVSSFGYRFVGDPSKMIHFCNLVSGSDKEVCFKQIGMSFLDWSDDKELAKARCSKIADREGTNWCLSVI